MPAPSQIGRTTAEYASNAGLGADDINRWANGYDLGPSEAAILVALVNAVNGRTLTSASQIKLTSTRREVSLSQGLSKARVVWYEWTGVAGPVRASFDVGDLDSALELGNATGGRFKDAVKRVQDAANDWSLTNKNRADAFKRVALQALALYASRGAAGYRLAQQTGRADERAAERAADEAAANRAAQARAKAFVRNPTSLDGSGAARMLDQARQIAPQVADRLLSKAARITEEAPETSTAEAVEAAGAELAAEDSSVLDVLYPLASPEFYVQDLGSLPVEWGLLFASFVVPNTSMDVELPDVAVFEASWPSVGRAWQNLLMHILYGSYGSTSS
jgi:hypothetical protein